MDGNTSIPKSSDFAATIGVSIDVIDLSYSISLNKKSKVLLRNINFSIQPAELCALMGPSGAGNYRYSCHNSLRVFLPICMLVCYGLQERALCWILWPIGSLMEAGLVIYILTKGRDLDILVNVRHMFSRTISISPL